SRAASVASTSAGRKRWGRRRVRPKPATTERRAALVGPGGGGTVLAGRDRGGAAPGGEAGTALRTGSAARAAAAPARARAGPGRARRAVWPSDTGGERMRPGEGNGSRRERISRRSLILAGAGVLAVACERPSDTAPAAARREVEITILPAG